METVTVTVTVTVSVSTQEVDRDRVAQEQGEAEEDPGQVGGVERQQTEEVHPGGGSKSF